MYTNIRRSLIFVDDVKFSLITTKDRLKKYYEVYPAQTAYELFELLELMRPDLILLDINMPDVNGFEILTRLKADERYEDIPVIFLSGQNDRDTVVIGLTLGAAAHVCKPYTVEALVDAIENVFKGKKGLKV